MISNFKKYFEGKNYPTLYHMTSMIYLGNMCRTDQIMSDKYLTDLYQDSDEIVKKRFSQLIKKYEYFISTTRWKNLHKDNQITNTTNTIIHLDGEKLTNSYKVIPVNFFNFDNKYQSLKHVQNESEEAILLTKNKPFINLSKYCTKIEIPSMDTFINELLDNNIDVYYQADLLNTIFEDIGYIEQINTEDYYKLKEHLKDNSNDIYGILREYIKRYCKKYNIEISLI
jgi:hypothetical protein